MVFLDSLLSISCKLFKNRKMIKFYFLHPNSWLELKTQEPAFLNLFLKQIFSLVTYNSLFLMMRCQQENLVSPLLNTTALNLVSPLLDTIALKVLGLRDREALPILGLCCIACLISS